MGYLYVTGTFRALRGIPVPRYSHGVGAQVPARRARAIACPQTTISNIMNKADAGSLNGALSGDADVRASTVSTVLANLTPCLVLPRCRHAVGRPLSAAPVEARRLRAVGGSR